MANSADVDADPLGGLRRGQRGRQQRGVLGHAARQLVLHGAQGLSYREIAVVVNISPAAAASALSRARDRFARQYTPIAEEVCS